MSKVNKMIEDIIKNTGLTAKVINQMVIDKREELKGLINEEGALFIVGKELGCDIGEPKTEEEQINKEISELQEEIQEENKEFLDIVKTPEYLVMYNALKRALRDTTIKIEIVNSENISRPPGEIKTEKPGPDKKDKIEFVDVAIIKDYSEKAYKIWNEEGLSTFIPKSAIKEIKDKRLHLTTKAKNWYIPEWKEDK